MSIGGEVTISPPMNIECSVQVRGEWSNHSHPRRKRDILKFGQTYATQNLTKFNLLKQLTMAGIRVK
jgi:hypothetical protein